MKKILFFAGLLAFVTSCTDDELISSGSYNQELPNGISFNGSVADVAESRGMLTYDEAAQNFPFFWYAEQDQINVYAFGEVKKYGAVTQTPEKSWAKLQNPVSATYKATQSKANGQFTAIDGTTNLLTFADSTASNKKNAEATFAATYKATVAEVSFDKNKAIDTIWAKMKSEGYKGGKLRIDNCFNEKTANCYKCHRNNKRQKHYSYKFAVWNVELGIQI